MARTMSIRKNVLMHALLYVTLMLAHQILSSNAKTTSNANGNVALYVFGDSLYDTGNGLYNNAWPSAKLWPYGMSFFKPPSGRFSDGRLIPDFIAQYANMSFPEPALKRGIDYKKAVNFAVSSACVLDDTRPLILNLKGQMKYFLIMVKRLKFQIGEAETNKVLSNAVYLFNIGGNDYVDLYMLNTKPLSPSLVTLKMNYILGNLSAQITTIYNQGGRKFAYNGISPMGCFPGSLQSDGSCIEALNELAKKHNAAVVSLVHKLGTQLPGSKFSVYDFYSSLSARLTNGAAYGFNVTKPACCGSGAFNGQFTCQIKGEFKVCTDPVDYVWFDAGHTSQSANQQFSQEFWSGSSDIVAPYNLKTLFSI